MDKNIDMRIAEIKKAIIPHQYEFVKHICSGFYGQVVECLKKDTRENVAVKLPLYEQNTEEEIHLLDREADQNHIVKFFGAFDTHFSKGMIFEMLEMSLDTYWVMHHPLPLSDGRTITKQVAIALEVLKDLSIIHADLHGGNVMICNPTQKPLRVKVIDFGLAMPTAKAKQGMDILLRPPEVILGLPFNEAVDVWTLGDMLYMFMLDEYLFMCLEDYDILKVTVKLFGAPSTSFLDKGFNTDKHFKRAGKDWILQDKTLEWDEQPHFTEAFSSVRQLMESHYKLCTLEENREIKEATLLLERMLDMDPDKRITPSEILHHPFFCDELMSTEVGDSMDEEQVGSVQTTITLYEIILVQPA